MNPSTSSPDRPENRLTPGLRPPLIWRSLGWASAVALLLLTFSFYTHPDFMLKLADKSWGCF